MSCCLANAPETLTVQFNRGFKPYLLFLFIDEILIYSRNKEYHEIHLRIVIDTLKVKSFMFSQTEF